MSVPLETSSLHHYLSATYGKITQLCLGFRHRVASSLMRNRFCHGHCVFLPPLLLGGAAASGRSAERSPTLGRPFGVLGGPRCHPPGNGPALLLSVTESSLPAPRLLLSRPCCQDSCLSFSEGIKAPDFKPWRTDWLNTPAGSFKNT